MPRPLVRRSLALAAALCLSAAAAHAGPWPFPQEISVPEAFNRLYGTSYETGTRAGLTAVVAERGLPMQTVWSTADFGHLEMLVFDTASTASFGLWVNQSFLPLYDPGPWTAPSRGWLPENLRPTVDLALFLQSHGLDPLTPFSFRQGHTVLDANNTYHLSTPVPEQWLFAFNDNGGLLAGDQDANEPMFCVFNTLACTQASQFTVPEPGSLALSLASLALLGAGRVHLRRRRDPAAT